jgi:hypothetical protein
MLFEPAGSYGQARSVLFRVIVNNTTKLSTDVLSAPEATTGHPGVMKRTVVRLTNDQVKALATMSKKALAPVSALVRQAVKEYLQYKRNSPVKRGVRKPN